MALWSTPRCHARLGRVPLRVTAVAQDPANTGWCDPAVPPPWESGLLIHLGSPVRTVPVLGDFRRESSELNSIKRTQSLDLFF